MSGRDVAPVRLDHALRGRWTARNSPADAVPSHGTERFATALSLDLVPVGEEGATAPVGLRALLGTEPPERFPGFGREVVAPIMGTVVRIHDGEQDHASHRGLSSVAYALTQRGRAADAWTGLAGNHLVIRAPDVAGDSVHVVLCHLRRGSLEVRLGRTVARGQLLAQCGNSGNSMEPHLHLQVMDDADVRRARAVPFVLPGGIPHRGELIDGA